MSLFSFTAAGAPAKVNCDLVAAPFNNSIAVEKASHCEKLSEAPISDTNSRPLPFQLLQPDYFRIVDLQLQTTQAT
tara:strand:+ start:1318 stop:1545 length:228 start_codon:yes stop_codon:yes gene_type:complete